MDNKEYKECLHYLNILIRNCEDAFGFIAMKIEAHIHMNKIEEAISFTTKLQEQYLQNPDFLYWRGLLLVYNGNSDKGKQFLREAINLDPDNSKYQKAWKNLVKMEKMKKEGTHNFLITNLYSRRLLRIRPIQ